MSDRDDMLRYHNLFTCPDWCTQPGDEEQYEQHHGEWSEQDTDGGVLRVRPNASWWDEHPDWVEIELAGQGAQPSLGGSSPDAVGSVLLAVADVDSVVDMLTEARDLVDGWRSGSGGWKWAYDGAEEDAAEVDAVEDVAA